MSLSSQLLRAFIETHRSHIDDQTYELLHLLPSEPYSVGGKSFPMECASCNREIEDDSMIGHFERFHTGPRPTELLQIACQTCPFQVSIENLQFMINHCVSEEHYYQGISEWRKFIEIEDNRMARLVELGIKTMKRNDSMGEPVWRRGNKSLDLSRQHDRRISMRKGQLDRTNSDVDLVLSDQTEEPCDRASRTVSRLQSKADSLEISHSELEEGVMEKAKELFTGTATKRTRKRKLRSESDFSSTKSSERPMSPPEMERVFKLSLTSSDPRMLTIQDPNESSLTNLESESASDSSDQVMSFIRGNSVLIKDSNGLNTSITRKADSSNLSTPGPKSHQERGSDGPPELSPSATLDRSADEYRRRGREVVKQEQEDPSYEWRSGNENTANQSTLSGKKKSRLRKLKCQLCRHFAPADNFITLFRHLTAHEDRLRKYECVTCSKRYDARMAANTHVRFSKDSNQVCEGFRLIHLDLGEQLRLTEAVLARAFPGEKVPDRLVTLRVKKSYKAPEERRETCQLCKRNVKCNSTGAAVNHSIRHDKSLGWFECRTCKQKFDAMSAVKRHFKSTIKGCEGEYKELIGSEMISKIQATVDKCFPKKKWDVRSMRIQKKKSDSD